MTCSWPGTGSIILRREIKGITLSPLKLQSRRQLFPSVTGNSRSICHRSKEAVQHGQLKLLEWISCRHEFIIDVSVVVSRRTGKISNVMKWSMHGVIWSMFHLMNKVCLQLPWMKINGCAWVSGRGLFSFLATLSLWNPWRVFYSVVIERFTCTGTGMPSPQHGALDLAHIGAIVFLTWMSYFHCIWA